MTALLPLELGPQCPHCRFGLAEDSIHSGAVLCPHCSREFEATVFHPPSRRIELVPEVTTVGPEGANACSTHARNAATASCQRCGLFICALCDMNVGSGSYCPNCFDRVRNEGSLQSVGRRYRDYASIARIAVLAGVLLSFMFLGVPCGALAVYYGWKARAQRRNEGRSVVGVTLLALLGVLEILGGLAWIGLMAYAIAKAPPS